MSQASSFIIDRTNSWAVRMADSILQGYKTEQWEWHYEHALLIKAIAAVGIASGEERFQKTEQTWVDHFIAEDGQIRTYCRDDFNLDQINPGKLLFPLYQRTRDPRYLTALQKLRSQLERQPRTPSGGYWHKLIYPNQMWLDGLYMAVPFLAEYAATFADHAMIADIIHQFVLIEQHTRDPLTGLLYHGWDETKSQPWADPVTGCSPNFWGRAIGWYAMAIVDTLDFLPAGSENHDTLVKILCRLAAAVIRYQDPVSGLWYQVVNLPERAGNYRESSASAMLAYSLAKAVRNGYLAPEFGSAAQRAYRGLLENMIRMDADGSLTLDGTCSVAGLGGIPYRNGSYEYYVNEPVALNDFKGVGPFILAALEMDKVLEKN